MSLAPRRLVLDACTALAVAVLCSEATTLVGRISGGISRAWGELPDGVRRGAISLPAYGVPAYFLSTFLMRLSGGVLWLPPQWRGTVLLTGLGLGFVLFNLARLHRPKPASGDARPARRRSRQQRDEAEAREREGARRWILKRAAAWYGVTMLLVCAYTLLRYECVHSWDPEADLVAGTFDVEESPAGEPFDAMSVPPPVYFEGGGPPYRGAFLFPLGYPWSAHGRRFEENLRFEHPDSNPREKALSDYLSRLLDVLRLDEKTALGLTIDAFYLLHVLTLAAASVAYAYSFAVVEELCSGLAGAAA